MSARRAVDWPARLCPQKDCVRRACPRCLISDGSLSSQAVLPRGSRRRDWSDHRILRWWLARRAVAHRRRRHRSPGTSSSGAHPSCRRPRDGVTKSASSYSLESSGLRFSASGTPADREGRTPSITSSTLNRAAGRFRSLRSNPTRGRPRSTHKEPRAVRRMPTQGTRDEKRGHGKGEEGEVAENVVDRTCGCRH